MRRAPIVMAATAAGLIGVLSFHTKGAHAILGGLPSATAGGSPTTSGPTGTSPAPSSTGSSPPPASTTPTTVPSTTPTTGSTTRTATGPLVNYSYGDLSVSVTVAGGKITKVGIGSLDDGGSFRSQSIDQESIPTLEQEAIQAQSANIQGVSGASYTSAGFEQSLQGALGKLGVS
jgi:uncharacterized protein with FMN-binding domain